MMTRVTMNTLYIFSLGKLGQSIFQASSLSDLSSILSLIDSHFCSLRLPSLHHLDDRLFIFNRMFDYHYFAALIQSVSLFRLMFEFCKSQCCCKQRIKRETMYNIYLSTRYLRKCGNVRGSMHITHIEIILSTVYKKFSFAIKTLFFSWNECDHRTLIGNLFAMKYLTMFQVRDNPVFKSKSKAFAYLNNLVTD